MGDEGLYSRSPDKSQFKELNNKPLLRIKDPFPSNTNSLECVLKTIYGDPNLFYFGVSKDIALILKSLFDLRDALLVNRMDSLMISMMGVELLIFESARSEGPYSFDRSMSIDLTTCRSKMFNIQSSLSMGVGLLALLIAGDNDLRKIIARSLQK